MTAGSAGPARRGPQDGAVAVIGCGGMGTMHGRALLDRGAHVLWVDAEAERAAAAARRIGGSAVAGVREAIEHGAGAAVVTTPSRTHPAVVGRLLRAGVATFCEKPLALEPDEVVEVGRLADERDVLLQVGFHRRFDPEYVAARDAVRAGVVGRVEVVRAGTHEAPRRAARVAECGSVLRDMLIHDFDAVRFVTGAEAVAVTASASGEEVDDDGGRDWSGVAAVLELDDGGVAVVTGGRPHPPGYDARLEVFGSRGSVAAGPGPARELASFKERFPAAYEGEMAGFLDTVAGARANPCTWRDAEASARIAVAAEHALVARRRVEIAGAS